MGKRNTGKGPNPKAKMGKMNGAMRREQKKNHGRLPGGKVASTVHGKARVGYTGVFLKAIQGKLPKGKRGGKGLSKGKK